MHQIQLTDQIYSQVKHRADEAGFASVDDYIVNLLTYDVSADAENLDHLFTQDRLAHIDSVIAKVNAGGATYTMDEVRENLAKNRADWIRENGQ